MKKLILLALLSATPVQAQGYPPYGGGPFRPDPNDWGPDERARRIPPPRGGYPILEDRCIAYGVCAKPRPRIPPFVLPPRYEDEGEFYDD
jgi:hypothetical protein